MSEHPFELTRSGLTVFDLGDAAVSEDGQIADFTLRLRGVLPNRRVAAAVTLTEQNGRGEACERGIRVVCCPPHAGPGPGDLHVGPIRFVLPAELDAGAAGTRRLTVQVDAHYIDSGAQCILAQSQTQT